MLLLKSESNSKSVSKNKSGSKSKWKGEIIWMPVAACSITQYDQYCPRTCLYRQYWHLLAWYYY